MAEAQGEVRLMDVPVYNMSGKEVGTMSIDEQALGGSINAALIKQAYVRYHANLRQGSSRTRGRKDIAGSTAKMYKQKGTGRARHSTKKVNLFKGGGHTFAKSRPKADYRKDMPTKMRRKANRNALLAKLIDNEVKIIDDLSLSAPKTKDFVKLMEALGIDRRALVALAHGDKSQNVRLGARNIDDVALCSVEQINCFELLNHRYLIVGKAELEGWLAGPSSQIDKLAKVAPMGRREETD